MEQLTFFVNIFYYDLITLGKGLLMIPLIQAHYVENLKILTSEQLLIAVAISRVTPGPANVYVASVGYMLFGFLGAFLALFAVALPSFSAIPLTSLYEKLKTNRVLGRFFQGLVMAATGLIFYSAYILAVQSLTSLTAWLVFALALILIQVLKINSIVSLFLASGFGLLLYIVLQ
jgi:chromate transporter